MFPVIVYFPGPIQLSLDVFLAQLSVSLHTSFVCNLMRYATRLHFCGGSNWGLIAFQAQSFLSLSLFFTHSQKLLRQWFRAPLLRSVMPHFKFTLGDIPIISQVMWWKWWLSLFSPGVLINSSHVYCIMKLYPSVVLLWVVYSTQWWW